MVQLKYFTVDIFYFRKIKNITAIRLYYLRMQYYFIQNNVLPPIESTYQYQHPLKLVLTFEKGTRERTREVKSVSRIAKANRRKRPGEFKLGLPAPKTGQDKAGCRGSGSGSGGASRRTRIWRVKDGVGASGGGKSQMGSVSSPLM